mgnify:CR=1 FL=1
MSEQIYHGKELNYSDILLVPKYSELDSRESANISFKLGKFTFNLPVVPSNMKTVIDIELCKQLDDNNYFCLPTFGYYPSIIDFGFITILDVVACPDNSLDCDVTRARGHE